ncbi:MAG: HEAT repeat domain-containing protein [Planctomycetota bacterium]
MTEPFLGQLRQDLANPRVTVRLRAVDSLSAKAGRGVAQTCEDEGVIPLLVAALSDSSRRVQRAAARGLRPWILQRPDLLGGILPEYATDVFDGTYTHVGIYGPEEQKIWIPRFAALRGHASLLADANTDRYFKFHFYVPGQAPGRFRNSAPDGEWGHLLLNFLCDWSYSQQRLIRSVDERKRRANLREQQCYGKAVMAFYRDAGLPYGFAVHHVLCEAGHKPRYELGVRLFFRGRERKC